MQRLETEGRRPLAIAMWDFSWIERRWPGAGFEEPGKALDELAERGYDAVRIDAFPHLFASGAEKEWTLLPVWYSNDWGSPYKNRIRLLPAFLDFLQECRKRGIRAALSSWYREDEKQVRMQITSPEKMAENWLAVLRWLKKEGLLDVILYVDLCNEWPGDFWAPYFINEPTWMTWSGWHTKRSMEYMKRSIEILRREFPSVPFCYSFDGWDVSHYHNRDLSFFDLAEHHIWMAKLNDGEYEKEVGKADNPRFSENYYHLMVDRAFDVYNRRKDYWDFLLVQGINQLAEAGKAAGLPLVTTECWGIVDYKDYPLLDWGWIKEICSLGVETASASGQWAIMATSNFASPQFVGMWRDIAWHRRLTDRIHRACLPELPDGNRLIRACSEPSGCL